MRMIPPPTLDITHTLRRKGVGRAAKGRSQVVCERRLDLLIEKGGLEPGQHDDWLGIVRTAKGGAIIHRHTAAESQMPLDVQIDFERIRLAVHNHVHNRAPGWRDPMDDYLAEGKAGKDGYYECPFCKKHVKGLRPFLRHLEGERHLQIIYLCDHELGPTTKTSCRQMAWRAPALNEHLRKIHGVKCGKNTRPGTRSEDSEEE